MTDIEKNIIELLNKSDRKAISLLYDNYAASLYGVVLRIVKQEQVAEDVMQEGFVKVWKNAKEYDANKAKLFTWLLRIFRNTAIDKLRSMKRKSGNEIQVDDLVVYEKGVSSFNPDGMDLQKHFEHLEDKYQSVIEAYFYQGLTHQQMSDEMDLPLGTIKSRIKIALRELRKIYIEKNIIKLIIISACLSTIVST